MIALLNKEDDFNTIFQQFAKYTPRTKDKNSYISKDFLWMDKPCRIRGDWHFNTTASLIQKQNWVQCIPKICFSNSFKFSTQFSDCAADFIANEDLKKYEPTSGKSLSFYQAYQEKIEKIDLLTLESVISMLH